MDSLRHIRLSRQLRHRRLHPRMHRFEQRPRSGLRESLLSAGGRPRISFSIPYSCAMRSRASFATGDRMRLMQIVELSSHMRPARRLDNPPGFVEPVETRIAIGLQNALIVLQMFSRMLTLAVGRVSEPYRRCRFAARWPVVANIGPQAACLRLPVARLQHRNRHVVAVQFLRAQHVSSSVHPPAAAASGSRRPPSRPASSGRFPRPCAHKSPTAGKAVSDQRTWQPEHAPATPDRPDRDRWADAAPVPAGCVRSRRSSVSAAPCGSPCIAPARIRASPTHPHRVPQRAAAIGAGFVSGREGFDVARQFRRQAGGARACAVSSHLIATAAGCWEVARLPPDWLRDLPA